MMAEYTDLHFDLSSGFYHLFLDLAVYGKLEGWM